MANNLERAGDGIENIAELLEELIEQNLHLSEGGLHDYEVISTKVKSSWPWLWTVLEGKTGKSCPWPRK